MIYVLWNNAYPQPAMGYWLKSFNADPPPVPGTSYSVAQINNLPLPSTAIFIVMALFWGWLSDGPMKGLRWPFIYAGAIIAVSSLPSLSIKQTMTDPFNRWPSTSLFSRCPFTETTETELLFTGLPTLV
jgi:hypothetical protein